jgi:hypothetical protein
VGGRSGPLHAAPVSCGGALEGVTGSFRSLCWYSQKDLLRDTSRTFGFRIPCKPCDATIAFKRCLLSRRKSVNHHEGNLMVSLRSEVISEKMRIMMAIENT